MNDVPEEELFSAYLDGEVTAGEQAQVEQLLAVSPAARQLMDELRALSVTLQSLPSHKIGEDISGDVLQAVQYRLINDPDEPEEPAAVPTWKKVFRRVAKPRNLVWPLAAAAAAILMMLNSQGPDARRDPGMAFHVPKAAAPEKAPAAGEELKRENENLEIRALPGDRKDFSRNAEADPGSERTHPGITAERRMDRAALKFRENSGETEAASSEAIDGVAGKPENLPGMAKAPAPAAPAPVASPTPAAPPSETVMPKGLAATETQPDLRMKAESASAARSGDAFEYKPGKGVDSRFGVAARVEVGKAGPEPVVLHYYVTPEAVRGDVLQTVLQKHQIAVARSERNLNLKTGEEKADARQSADAKKVDLPSRGRPLIVEAEATPEQLEAALVELRSRPAMFVAMSSPAGANELSRMRAAPMRPFEAKGAPQVDAAKPAEGEMSTQSALGSSVRDSDFMRGSGYGGGPARVMQGQTASEPASRYQANDSAEPSPAARPEAAQAGGRGGLKPKASRAMKSITADPKPSLGRPKPADQPAVPAREPMAEQQPLEKPQQVPMMQQQKLADGNRVHNFSDSLQEKQQDFAQQGQGQQSQELMRDEQAIPPGRQRVQFVLHLLPENTTAGAARAAIKSEGAEAVQHDAAIQPAQPPAAAAPTEK